MKPIRPLFHNRLGPYGMGHSLYVAFQRWPEDGQVPPFPGLTAVIQQARDRGSLFPEEAKHLRDVFEESLRESRYKEWLGSLLIKPIFEEPGWSEKDHYEKYKLFRFASLVDLARPGEIDWLTPDPSDIRLALRLLGAFLQASGLQMGQQGFISKLFDAHESLKELARTRQRGHHPADREIFRNYAYLEGRALAEALEKAGFKGFRTSPLAKYEKKRDSFYTLVSRWKAEIAD